MPSMCSGRKHVKGLSAKPGQEGAKLILTSTTVAPGPIRSLDGGCCYRGRGPWRHPITSQGAVLRRVNWEPLGQNDLADVLSKRRPVTLPHRKSWLDRRRWDVRRDEHGNLHHHLSEPAGICRVIRGTHTDGKASACNAGDLGAIPGSGRSSGEGNGNPLQYSGLEKSHGWRSLVGLQSVEWQRLRHD